YIVDKNGREVGKEKIIDAIWGDFDEKRASSNFSTCLYNMRKALKEFGFSELLSISNNMYKLDMEQISSEIQQYDRCLSHPGPVDSTWIIQFEEVIEKCD